MTDTYDATRDIDCARCGATFEAEGTMTEGMRGIQGETPDDPDEFKPESPHCPACLELGCEPPASPCCGTALRGEDCDPLGWRYTCGCFTSYPVASIHAYSIGLSLLAVKAAL